MKKSYLSKVGIVVTIILQGVIPFSMLYLRTQLIDKAVEKSDKTIMYLLLYLAFFVSNIILLSIRNALIEFEKIIILEHYDLKYMEKISKIKLSEYENIDKKRLIMNAQQYGEMKTNYISSGYSIVAIILQIISYMVAFLVENYVLFLVIFGLSVCGILLITLLSKLDINFWPKYMERMRLSNYYSRVLLGREYASEKKIYDYYQFFNDSYENEAKKAIKSNKTFGKKRFLHEMYKELISYLFIGLNTVFLVFQYSIGKISIGSFLSLFLSITSIYALIILFSSTVAEKKVYKKQLAILGDIYLIDEYKYYPCEVPIVNNIELKNITFGYPGEKKDVIKNFSFHFSCNKKYALIGENGCGKSTLVKLLLGMYEPSAGQICINDYEIGTYSRNVLNSIYAVVFQEGSIYPISIKENIVINIQEYKDYELKKILEDINLDDLVNNLPNGMDESLCLEDNGVRLSGGQFQKIAIARALVKESQVVILDEPNSALDAISEAKMYKMYQRLFIDKCTIMITHRLGAVKDLDEIIVMKDGMFLASGSHEELLKSCHYYNELYHMQKEMYDYQK